MTRVFLVDDHPMVREGLRTVLESAGIEVLGEAGEPATALAEIGRLAPNLIVLDLLLGAHSGLDLLQELRRRTNPVAVMVFTFSERPGDLAQALRLGALGYVLKGADRREVLDAVSQVAAGRRYLARSMSSVALSGVTATASGDPLSARELQIVTLAVRGLTSAQAGEALHLSPRTVDTYRSRAMAKLGVAHLPALVRWALREGLVDLDDL